MPLGRSASRHREVARLVCLLEAIPSAGISQRLLQERESAARRIVGVASLWANQRLGKKQPVHCESRLSGRFAQSSAGGASTPRGVTS
jgi:hypothetical protein